MIENQARKVSSPCSIGTFINVLFFSASNTDVAHDNVVAIWAYSVIPQCNTWSRGSLACYGRIRVDGKIGFQFYNATDIKNDSTWTTLFQCPAQGVWDISTGVVLECGNMVYLCRSVRGSSTRDITSVTLSTREGRSLVLCCSSQGKECCQ